MSSPSPSIYVATPCFGGMAHAVYARGLLALKAACAERRISLAVELGGGDALISRARAILLAKFLMSPATHMILIDADIGFEPEQVFRLMAANKPVIGGAYARKPATREPAAPSALELEDLPGIVHPETGPRQVASVGSGFLQISRAAAQRLVAAHPELRAKLGDVQGGAFSEATMVFDPLIDPTSGRYLPDHQAFCRRWRNLGEEVWADLDVRLKHVGEAAYTTPEVR